MTRVDMVCPKCGSTARRNLDAGIAGVGCRGVRETDAELARCPRGHGRMVRKHPHWKGQK